MALLQEASPAPSTMAAVLESGINTLSANQTISFAQYSKVVLSQDGSVFWVANGHTLSVDGSLHYITDRHQDDDQTIAANRFIFTATEEISAFNTVNPTTLWIGAWTVDGVTLQIAFADRGSFYQEADAWHYSGYAVYPAMSSQLVQSSANLPVGPIVSNSLPIWLAQNSMAPVYPSFLVPDNIAPPYVVAHIGEEDTTPIGSFPIIVAPGTSEGGTGSPTYQFSSSQLMKDKVRLILYGFTNQMAIQYLSSLMTASLADTFGFCTSPVIRDAKRTQAEIASVAMKKTLDFEASYYQGTADAFAERYILSAAYTLNVTL